jgi:hypothetical protein
MNDKRLMYCFSFFVHSSTQNYAFNKNSFFIIVSNHSGKQAFTQHFVLCNISEELISAIDVLCMQRQVNLNQEGRY